MRSLSAFDAEEIRRAVQKDAKRHEQLYQRLSRVIGPFDYVEMTTGELTSHGLKKLNRDVPDDDDAKVIALESYLEGRAHGASGGAGSMDAAPPLLRGSFLDKYLNS
jgi:hypothetical protein